MSTVTIFSPRFHLSKYSGNGIFFLRKSIYYFEKYWFVSDKTVVYDDGKLSSLKQKRLQLPIYCSSLVYSTFSLENSIFSEKKPIQIRCSVPFFDSEEEWLCDSKINGTCSLTFPPSTHVLHEDQKSIFVAGFMEWSKKEILENEKDEISFLILARVR